MRAPNHEIIKAKCKDAIPALLEKFGLGVLREFRADQNGWVNPCIFVNEELVFRFNARDPHLPKFQREKLIYDLLKTSAVPVPQKVLLDDSKEVCAYDVLISEKLTGFNFEAEWPNIAVDERLKLAEQAGRLQKALNSYSAEYFGELTASGPFTKHATWLACLEERLHFHLNDCQKLGVFSADEDALFRAAFDQSSQLLESVQKPSLIHGDFHFGNLLVANGKINAVLDYEWAFAGDPLYDLSNWADTFDIWQQSRGPFLKGLGLELSEEDRSKIKVYKMLRNIELCAVAQRYFSAEEAKEYKPVTLSRLR